MSKTFIEFRLTSNKLFTLNGEHFFPPMAMREVATEHPLYGEIRVIMPVFDMDFVHRMEVPSQVPVIPPQGGFSDEHYSRLKDAALTRALAVGEKLSLLRAELRYRIADGSIEIVDDPEGITADDSTPIAEPTEEMIEARREKIADSLGGRR